jgi:hypothetical protein
MRIKRKLLVMTIKCIRIHGKDDRGESISLELVDQRIDSKFGSLTRRIDVIEKSLIECTDKLSKNLLLHNENKNEVWSELSELTNQIKTTRICNKEAHPTPLISRHLNN